MNYQVKKMKSAKCLCLAATLVLSACVQSRLGSTDPTEPNTRSDQPAFGEKCEDAKYQLEKTVEEGQTSNLRELKRNIELYCVWRRN